MLVIAPQQRGRLHQGFSGVGNERTTYVEPVELRPGTLLHALRVNT